MGRMEAALRRLERRVLRALMGMVAAIADRRVGRHLASRLQHEPDSEE